jgi:hypothetical protein
VPFPQFLKKTQKNCDFFLCGIPIFFVCQSLKPVKISS